MSGLYSRNNRIVAQCLSCDVRSYKETRCDVIGSTCY